MILTIHLFKKRFFHPQLICDPKTWGGMIVYSTCTFSRENEEVIQDALDRHPNIHLVSILNAPDFLVV